MALELKEGLSRDEQFEEAAKYAGVPASVLRSMWKVESTEGTDMGPSAAGAEGHFQIMPKTRATWEGRNGRTYDPYNFEDGLALAADTMRENMSLAKGNVGDALRWYNAGAPERWNNDETNAYVGKVLGTDEAGGSLDVPATSVADAMDIAGVDVDVTRPQLTERQMWETSASDIVAQQNKDESGSAPKRVQSKMEKGLISQAGIEAATAAIIAGGDPTQAALNARAHVAEGAPEIVTEYLGAFADRPVGGGAMGSGSDATKAMIAGEQQQAELDSWDTFGNKLGAAMDQNSLTAGISRWMERSAQGVAPADPSWNYMDHIEEIEKFRSEAEIEELRTARSAQEVRQITAQLDQERHNSMVLGANNGALAELGWNLAGGTVGDPVGLLAGVGVGKVFQMFGIGARAAFVENQIAKGYALSGAEGAVGNIAFTAGLDAMGEYQSTNDYALSAGFGMLIGSAFGAVEWKTSRSEAAMGELKKLADEIAAAAAARNAELFKRAEAEAGPGATPTEIATIAQRLDTEDMEKMQAVMLGDVPDEGRIGPDQSQIEAHQELAPDEAAPSALDGPKPFRELPTAGLHYAVPKEHRMTIEGLNSGFPVDRRIYEGWVASLKGKSMSPILDAIASIPEMREDFRLLAGKLSRVADVSGLTPDFGRLMNESFPAANSAAGAYFPDEHAIGLRSVSPDIVLHEVVHAFSHRELASNSVFKTGIRELMDHVQQHINDNPDKVPLWVAPRLDPRNASTPLSNESEFLAYGFTDASTQAWLRSIPAPVKAAGGNAFANAWEWLVDAVRKVVSKDGAPVEGSVLDELMRVGSALLDDSTREIDPKGAAAPSLGAAPAASVAPAPAAPKSPDAMLDQTALNNTRRLYQQAAQKYGLDKSIPDDAERKLIAEMYVRSEAILSRHNIDKARLQPLLAKVGWEATSTRLLASDNPILRAFALVALENPEGAAQRSATASITKQMLYHLYRGDADAQFKSMYAIWRDQNGGSAVRDFTDEKLWRRFNREVYAERDRRWNMKPAQQAVDPTVEKAATMLDAAYKRMGADQVYVGTLGNQRIDPNANGYQPRMLSPGMANDMTDSQIAVYLQALSGEFQATAGMDKAFSDKFAREYLARARTEAKGAYDVPMTLHDPAGADIVRDALKALGMTQQQILASLERFSRGGASHTKSRINADLTTFYDDGKGGKVQMMDMMVTDNLYLLNRYANRVSGEVALAKFGILGAPGLKLMRKAAENGPDGMRASVKELEAFDQTAAEFLGRPFGTQLGKWADNARAATSALRLGGMGFNQMNEYANGVAALGVGRVFSAIAAIPRLRKEVLSAAAGKTTMNPVLGSLELYGGKFGAGEYQLKGMFDVNEGHEIYGQEALTVIDKAIRAGSHANRILSGHRAITAVQVRGMAEQIVMKSLRMIREGKDDLALNDMGFTASVRAGILADINTAATFGPDGEVISFDITKITDNAAASAYISSVHRGANQIIQNTYIGETGKWAHDGFLRLLTQFRTYGLTATQKQWRRQAFTYGTGRALLLMLGCMSVALPIHLARVQLRSIGREDRDEFLDRELSPLALGRATMNYAASVGLLPDLLDVGSSLTGGTITGGRAGNTTPFIGGQILPAAGVVNDAWKAAQERDPHKAVKLLPGSNLPYLQGAVNMLDE